MCKKTGLNKLLYVASNEKIKYRIIPNMRPPPPFGSSGSTFQRFYVSTSPYPAGWLASQSPLSGLIALSQASEPSLRPHSPVSGLRALYQASEPSLRPKSPLSGLRALSQASEPSLRPVSTQNKLPEGIKWSVVPMPCSTFIFE